MLGMLLIIVSMLMASSRRALPVDGQQGAYVFKGLALSLFAVGAFSVGRGLLAEVPANTLDMGHMTIGGWIFALPLLMIFLFGFSRISNTLPVPARYTRNERADD